MSNVATAPLTSDSARQALDEACATAGLRVGPVELVRFGENALFRLPSLKLVARVGRSTDAAVKEVHVSHWLNEHGLTSSKLASIDSQPLVCSGYPVSFWHLIRESAVPPSSTDLGKILRTLHDLPHPTGFQLPRFEPMSKVEKRLHDLRDAFDRSTIRSLISRREHLLGQLGTIRFDLDEGPIHGDAHRGNLMRTVGGSVVLIDLEDFMYGPREWDILVEASRFRPFGWASEEDYRSFCVAYGCDVMTWPGYETLLAARQLNMTTWLMQRHGESPEVDKEIRRRIRDLLSGDVGRAWTVR